MDKVVNLPKFNKDKSKLQQINSCYTSNSVQNLLSEKGKKQYSMTITRSSRTFVEKLLFDHYTNTTERLTH